MAPASVSSAATAVASTAAAAAVMFMSPLREKSETATDAVPSSPISEAVSQLVHLGGTSDAELSALFDAPKQMVGSTAVAIRAVPGQLVSLGSKLEAGLRDDLKFFALFAVSAIVVLATILLMAKYKPSTHSSNNNGSSKTNKQAETLLDFFSPNTAKKLDGLFVNAEVTESVPTKFNSDDSPSNRTEATDEMTEAVQIDITGKLPKKKPSKKIDADLETIGTVTSTASKGLSNKAKLGKYEVTLRSPFKKGVGIRTPLKGKKLY